MSLMHRLKEHCHSYHMQIRESKYAAKIMTHELTQEEYIEGLLLNYLFHRTIERGIEEHLPNEWKEQINWSQRKKAEYVKNDLCSLGQERLLEKLVMHVDQLPFSIQSAEEALGALYVSEGTAIGGAVIKKNLLKIDWVMQQSVSISFYGCYGKQLSSMWKQFIEFLNEVEVTQREVITKARETFIFYNCLKKALPSIRPH
ncbi:MAG: biliverdin-producing heme oxygenase [Flammeovirgaceae bacterium]